MNISELHAKAARLERELQETRDLLAQANHDVEAITADLARTRAYAFNAATIPVEDVVEGGANSLSRYGFCVIDNVIPTSQVDSIILIEPGVAYFTKSDAALEIAQDLGGLWKLSSVFNWIPKSIRDVVYDFVARNRYKWFGKKEACMVPTPELRAKFLG